MFRQKSSTVQFMRTMKDWFDMHNTSFGGTGQEAPIVDVDNDQLLWLENEFTCYVTKVQVSLVTSGIGLSLAKRSRPFFSLQTWSTVETTQYLLNQGINCVLTRKLNSDPKKQYSAESETCGGNDMLDARTVTTALDRIVKSRFARQPEVVTSDTDVDQLVNSLSVTFSDDLKKLRETAAAPPLSVTCSGLAYFGGHIAKLITDLGANLAPCS